MKKAIFLLLLVCMSNGWLFANHWTPDDSTYEDNMTLTGVVQINGVEQQSTTLEVGVFCGEECRGSGLLTYFFPTQRYVVQLLVFGEAGDQLTFKLYDHALGQELNLVSQNTVTFTADGYGSLSNPYMLNFIESGNHWIPNESGYEDNMTLTGVIQINGVEQSSTTLEVGVFCGEECRGTGKPTYFFPTQRYVVQLLIFGESGDQLTFKLYDHAVGEVLDLISPEAVTFTANGYGSLGHPYVLDFGLPSATQTIELSQGWNWWSSNVEITLTDLEDALIAAYPNASVNSLIIKSNGSGQTAWNPTAHRWVGGLNTLDLSQMYMIKVTGAGEITLQGVPINPVEHPVTIANGNNWIAFPLSENMTVTEAFAGFPANGDVVKSNNGGQATWNSTANRWIGRLTTLEPGKGYIYNSKASGNKTFVFPIGAK